MVMKKQCCNFRLACGKDCVIYCMDNCSAELSTMLGYYGCTAVFMSPSWVSSHDVIAMLCSMVMLFLFVCGFLQFVLG